MSRHDEAKAQPGSRRYSLSKLLGRKVVDVIGSPTQWFSDDPCFSISVLVLDDGTQLSVEGEHDIAYLVEGVSDAEKKTAAAKRVLGRE